MSRRRAAAGQAVRRERADVLLVQRALADSRGKAQALIMAGQVRVGEERVEKSGTLLPVDAPLQVAEGARFVSRGGDKLVHALEVFAAAGLSVEGKRCVDIGASTGGFTDCLLQHGAAQVVAVDVGYGQLHPKLRADPRVEVRERVNARHLTAGDLGAPAELVVVDASFIGIGKLTDAIVRILAGDGELVALLKPQFEAGREAASKSRGVIRDDAVRESALDAGREALRAAGLHVVAETDSALRGPKGNLERFVYARRRA